MIRIRRIFDAVLPGDRDSVTRVQGLMRVQFPDVPAREIDELPAKLADPITKRFRTILFVAETHGHELMGFALLMHAPEERFGFLDYIASDPTRAGHGVGAALYERVTEECRLLETIGLFFECPPDQEEHCPEEDLRRQNASRLRFYERFGARPIDGTEYQTPVNPGDRHPPHLLYDGLEPDRALTRKQARRVVRAILERKYSHLCPASYVTQVVESFRDDPVRIRPFRYRREAPRSQPTSAATAVSTDYDVLFTVNDLHDIHHIKERGYVEAPVRISAIERELGKLSFMRRVPVREFPERTIEAVHDREFVRYLRTVCEALPEGKSVYPYVFPIRNATRPPADLATRAGYYCIDTFTPLHRNAWRAARRAVNCALTAADALVNGHRLAYALVRPPGHHAERRSFGGFCYLNSAAVAAQHLLALGPVAMLDIDYHHGNGQQEIFYQRSDVLTVSIHGHPRFAYPYFSGFEDERGEGEGLGFNRNYALPEVLDAERYKETLDKALRRVAKHDPAVLVVLLGLDTARGDPTGTWQLSAKDFHENGRAIARLRRPTLVVQEGGYRTRTLGVNARHFFDGLRRGLLEVG